MTLHTWLAVWFEVVVVVVAADAVAVVASAAVDVLFAS